MSVELKKVLNVVGNNKAIPLPPQYAEFEHLLLDIDPKGSTDIVCDARNLTTLEAGQFDAVYCSHNLEHYYRHDVPRVLAGFLHVLKDSGFAQIRVPDLNEVMRVTIERGLDVDDVLYQSPAGPIMVLDVLYGNSVEIERSSQEFFAHKTGFTQKSLVKVLQRAGFSKIYSGVGKLEINAFAFKGRPDQNYARLVSRLFVSVRPITCDVTSNAPRDLRLMGKVTELEYLCFTRYAQRFRQLPEFNDKARSPKYSLSVRQRKKVIDT